MECIDFFSLEGLSRCVHDLATLYRLDFASSRMPEGIMRTCLGSDALERARTAVRSGRKVLRELPFVRPLANSSIEEGKIDLLFEEPDGWVLVDCKRDWVQKNAEEAETSGQWLVDYISSSHQ